LIEHEELKHLANHLVAASAILNNLAANLIEREKDVAKATVALAKVQRPLKKGRVIRQLTAKEIADQLKDADRHLDCVSERLAHHHKHPMPFGVIPAVALDVIKLALGDRMARLDRLTIEATDPSVIKALKQGRNDCAVVLNNILNIEGRV
jgi:hypothetical protein